MKKKTVLLRNLDKMIFKERYDGRIQNIREAWNEYKAEIEKPLLKKILSLFSRN